LEISKDDRTNRKSQYAFGFFTIVGISIAKPPRIK
jgi:hypothetical protein